jgi:RNA polymerase sigma factor (sigma-70 family)
MRRLSSKLDFDWWNDLKNDDPQALGYLYDAYVDKLFLSAMYITTDRELAKDAIQEVFIEIWKYRKGLGQITNSRAYLTKVLGSILFKKLRKPHLIAVDEISETVSNDLNVEERIISLDNDLENHHRLNAAISKLSKRQKLILELSFYQSLTYEQIAVKLNLNYQSVNNLAFRTFRRLREAMTPVIIAFLLS